MQAYIHENILHKRQFDLQFSIRFEIVDDVNFYSPFHWHNHIELLYIIDGEIEFRIEEKKINLKTGDVIIVNSEIIHSSKLFGHVKYILLQVPLSAFNGIYDNPESIKITEQPDKAANKKIVSFLKNMLVHVEDKKPESQLKFISLLYDFLYLMVTEMKMPEEENIPVFLDSGIKRIAPVMSYIEKNFRSKISLPDVASIINVSSEHMCRMFKKYTDMTFNEYLMALRISSFYQGLMTSDQKISTLLEENGITNYKVFIRDFKEIFGRTPEEVRTLKQSSGNMEEIKRPVIKDGLEKISVKKNDKRK